MFDNETVMDIDIGLMCLLLALQLIWISYLCYDLHHLDDNDVSVGVEVTDRNFRELIPGPTNETVENVTLREMLDDEIVMTIDVGIMCVILVLQLLWIAYLWYYVYYLDDDDVPVPVELTTDIELQEL